MKSPFTAAERFAHGQPERTGVLLVQLGTPEAPTAPALRAYLRQFLSDPRVVEIPPLLWQPILRGPILAFRPAKSAAKYATVWTEEGSPLRVNSEKQAALLRGWLGDRGHDVDVALAMRYGEPSIPAVMRRMRERNLGRLLVLPLYPQYSGSTTATAIDAVCAELARWRNAPELRTVKHFHDDPAYIDALAASVRRHWEREGRAEKLVMSFHGVPERTLRLGDPYHCECQKTGRLLAERLELAAGEWLVTFQSRFGKAKWLEPYTEPTLVDLAAKGLRSVDVMCPGFVADCLETLEEIAQEARHAFLGAGGREFRYVPCLNDAPAFIDALAGLVERHTAGWPTLPPGDPQSEAAQDRARAGQRERAIALGAAG